MGSEVKPPAYATLWCLLPLPHVQFWQTENSGRLDSSYRGGHRRHIPCLVDAAGVCALNAAVILFELFSHWTYNYHGVGMEG